MDETTKAFLEKIFGGSDPGENTPAAAALEEAIPEEEIPMPKETIPEVTPAERGVVNRCYTPEDLMVILHAGKNTVYNLIKENQFRSFQLGKGGRIRISKKSFDDWLEKQL